MDDAVVLDFGHKSSVGFEPYFILKKDHVLTSSGSGVDTAGRGRVSIAGKPWIGVDERETRESVCNLPGS